jgi:hypothetical protein
MPAPLIAPLLEKLKNTPLPQQIAAFDGTPVDVSAGDLEAAWAALGGNDDVRRAIRDIAKIPFPLNATDKDPEFRLPQVLTALGVLSQRVQVELVLSDTGGMKIGCPPAARYCLAQPCKPGSTDLKSNGKNCCRRMNVHLGANNWAQDLANFGVAQRAGLGLPANVIAHTYVFVNPGTLEMMAISSD